MDKLRIIIDDNINKLKINFRFLNAEGNSRIDLRESWQFFNIIGDRLNTFLLMSNNNRYIFKIVFKSNYSR
jgi:hypothetical protein